LLPGRSFFEGQGKKTHSFRSAFGIFSHQFILCFFVFLGAPVHSSQADELKFVPVVQFKLVSTFGGGDVGSLSTTVGAKDIQMRLSNVAVAGADKTQELISRIDKSNLSLISSIIHDVVKGQNLREMQRKVGTSLLDNSKADIFEFKEVKDGRVTTTEPYVEFKVVDFISVIYFAADAINRKETQPVDLSMLRDRSVTRVTMKISGQETIGGRPGTVVRVAPPDNPSGGISYTIARTDDGSYYPARISVETSKGLVQLDGQPQ
jgi:hypothetical protein